MPSRADDDPSHDKPEGMMRVVLWLGIGVLTVGALWWVMQKPSHDRVWADDVAHMLQGDVQGSQVVLRNVRNFEWRSLTDYTPRWETREYDLDQLVRADLLLSYWMGPQIAHTLVSFGFEDGRYITFSLEIRKEVHEEFSAWRGFFRQFEAIMVAADEADIVRTRTNAREEDVYLYRLDVPPEQLREVFLAYVARANALAAEPEFYNTLTSNCTTVVFDMARQIAPGLPLDYRLLLSGYFAEYAYDQGALAKGFGYSELRSKGHIVERAKATPIDGDFSAAIRRGVP